ncbi:MAG: tRNA (guanosine(37)-N1)-methyltransferase TrmD, partial [Actinobacteria bacterium]|nr:tRNA (guanosine(37)-N1)-methyltransferase TrmD [Actinomycetota bacterium]
MRIDAISIFPDFFSVLDISLLGKAREAGLIEFKAHD